jgi:hypothetical protein
MAASPMLRGLFVLLLALSVGIKIIAGNQSVHSESQTVRSTAKDEIATFLNDHGFQVGEVEADPDFPFVTATAGDCRVLAVLAAPQGWHRDIVHRLALPHDQGFFVFGGVVYQDQPTWLTRMHEYWRVLNNFAGRKLPVRPVLGIVASPACDLRDIPWRELAELS